MMSTPMAKGSEGGAPLRSGLVVLTGNPNSGKTTLFNALTGLRAKVGNYAGVTVERKEGRLQGTPPGRSVTVLDLPGTYSLSPQSLDERVSRDVLLQRVPGVPAPDVVVVVVDASNLERNLYYATQVIELGYPTVLALNMVDIAASGGQEIDPSELSARLGVPVVPMVASTHQGLKELREAMLRRLDHPASRPAAEVVRGFPDIYQREAGELSALLASSGLVPATLAPGMSRVWLGDQRFLQDESLSPSAEVRRGVEAARARLEAAGLDWRAVAIEARYGAVAAIHGSVMKQAAVSGETFSDRVDRVVTHKIWGMVIFVGIMALMFQTIFSLAQYPMDWIEGGVGWIGVAVGGVLPEGELRSLLVDGAIAGVGAVVVFLPQICLLFLFIGLLEDTGYMARAAFLMDRLMSKVGLHGKSFIPMLSSFACAIPGIMATRTIENPKDRLATIMVAPLMSCSARLPVYTVLIAACIPDRRWLGGIQLQGLVMLGMYLLGLIAALFMAWVFKRTLLRGAPPLLIMELPPYKRPVATTVLRHMWERSKLFLRRAGTVILGLSILLWFLATYPRDRSVADAFEVRRQAVEQEVAGQAALSEPERAEALRVALQRIDSEEAGERLRRSFAGRLGHLIEPMIAPLGFDWKIGIGVIASFAAREVFVSTMSTVYNVAGVDDAEESNRNLADVLRVQTRADGTRLYTPLLGITLMVFYVFALQCVSTVAVTRRETNGWKWPAVQWLYMGVLAWGGSFVTWRIGRWFGFE